MKEKDPSPIVISDEDEDYGFGVKDGLLAWAETENEIQLYKDKLNQLYKAIMPLLNNLRENPESSMIHWPNRIKDIDEFVKKINKIVEEDKYE